MKLTPSLTVVPYLHGKLLFTDHLRRICLDNHFDCMAIDLPPLFETEAAEAVDKLPFITAITASGAQDPVYYIPVDPCDPTIEALRVSKQERIPCVFTGWPVLYKPKPLPPLPDEYALQRIGFDAFCSLCLLGLGAYVPSPEADSAARFCAARLRELSEEYTSVCALVHLGLFTNTVRYFAGRDACVDRAPDQPFFSCQSWQVNPDHLYFALGELPFVTGTFEKTRYEPFTQNIDPVDAIKDLFRETRDSYFDSPEQIITLSPARIQVALQFLRNLTVMSGRFIPDLFDIVVAAKGIGGNAYALRILKSAKYYPYLPFETNERFISIGIDRIMLPDDDTPREAVNLFKDTFTQWRKIPLKPDHSLEKNKHYRFRWNPAGMCSYVPEDVRIESFNAHVRKKTQRVLCEDFIKSEKFLTSVKDGIDIRETLRNWHTGDIYIKELPPSRGDLDTVVVVFDDGHDEKYPHRATWYAEHPDESTLTFYATDFFDRMIGPGIGRSNYGGLSLLFPPRPIPNIFEMDIHEPSASLAQRLTFGAMLFSNERIVGYVAQSKPDLTMRRFARALKKHLVWIPLSSFSNETLRRLRRFHILNGKTVRSWATRFIGD